jgi:hypothetical protein
MHAVGVAVGNCEALQEHGQGQGQRASVSANAARWAVMGVRVCLLQG